MRKLSIITILLLSTAMYAQSEYTEEVTEGVVIENESDDIQDAEFPGGSDAMYDFITQNLKYPAKSKAAGEDGEVMIEFTVNTDGSLSNIVVVEGINDEMDKEALRVVKSMPMWIPAMSDGNPVESTVTVGVGFWEE